MSFEYNRDMEKDLIAQLCQQGLTEKESKIYIALLQLGTASAGTIARFCSEKRPTVYSVLWALHAKGYIEIIEAKGTTHYIAKTPVEILQKAKDKISIFESIIPLLQNLEGKIGSKPQIRYLEWMDGLRELFEDFLTTDVEMKIILGTHNKFKDLQLPFATKVREARIKKWTFTRRIVTNREVDPKKEKIDDKKFNRKTVIVSDFMRDLNADINIYGPNKVSLHFFDERRQPHSIIIHSKELFETMDTLFEYIWGINSLKK